VSRGGALLAAVLAAAGLACTTPLDVGERHYRDGDRLAALETWRRIPPGEADHRRAQERIAEVEQEFRQLVVRYKQRGRYFAAHDRLAESTLNYRLALKLQPDDRETLALVQDLSRQLAARKRETGLAFRADLELRALGPARAKLATLRQLDPFDPELETEARRLEQLLAEELETQMAAGRTSFGLGDLRGAERAFRRVLELEPGNESAQGYLAYASALRASGGSLPGGLDPARLPASQQEIRAEGFYRNALAAERADDPWAAIRHDLSALEANPDHAEARRHLERLRAHLAPQVETLVESGRAHYLQEDLQSALDQWRRALLVDPDNPRAVEYVERANRLLENLEKLRADAPGGPP
jgi:tetratricopeptide (TPR) repeat protein